MLPLILSCGCISAGLYPPLLQKGDLVALVFPGFFLEKDKAEADAIMLEKAHWLQSKGFRVTYYPKSITPYGYFSAPDTERAHALMSAWKNENVKAIWCFRGGYGCQRILDLLDYEWIKTHPKVFIGMSDVTALHSAIGQKTGLVTFLSPVLNYYHEKKSEFDDAYAFNSLKQVVMNQPKGEIALPSNLKPKALRPGKAKGKLVGGNLTLIAALCGTKWQLDTKGKILVLEEIGERLYRIDRMLWQLKECGMLDNLAGVVLGGFTDIVPHTKSTFTLDEIFKEYFRDKPYPVLMNFPTGHDSFQATLPLNYEVVLDADNAKVFMHSSS